MRKRERGSNCGTASSLEPINETHARLITQTHTHFNVCDIKMTVIDLLTQNPDTKHTHLPLTLTQTPNTHTHTQAYRHMHRHAHTKLNHIKILRKHTHQNLIKLMKLLRHHTDT